MEPVKFTINIYQGAAWRLKATFKDPDGNPLDLSDYSAKMQIRRSVASPDALITLDNDGNGGIILTDDAQFNLTARLSKVQTEDLPTHNQEIEDWVYGIILWQNADPDFTPIRLVEGLVRVFPSPVREDEP